MDIMGFAPQAEWKYEKGMKMGCPDGEVKVHHNGEWQTFGYEEDLKRGVEALRKVLADWLYIPFQKDTGK